MNRASTTVLLAYWVLNAAAYSILLPPWEGFDETYHYGYVQFLSTQFRFPVLGHATLSREIWHAIQLSPVSHYIQGFTGAPMNFGDYFKLSREKRDELRGQLESIPSGEKYLAQSDKPNYEVNQPPLAYVWMAAIDWALSGRAITTRLLWIRLLCAIPAVLLLAHAASLLSRQLSLAPGHANAMLFCVFSSQMLYATLCHVCNDWLAVPLFSYFIWAAIRVRERGSRLDSLWLGLLFAAGLLTKAYFLFLTPLAVFAVWRRHAVLFVTTVALVAGPWYVRNVLLYHDLSGTSEKTSGVSLKELLHAALSLPWRESIVSMAHSGLWTGNNSFTTFSSMTLNLVLLLLAVALVMNLWKPSSMPARVTFVAIFLFCCGLAYITIVFYAGSKGAVWAAVPWYMQVLLAPVLLVAFRGMSGASIVARLTIVLWGYILVATYLVKLIPMYGGFPEGRAHLSDLWRWYAHDAHPTAVFWLTGVVILVSCVAGVNVMRRHQLSA